MKLMLVPNHISRSFSTLIMFSLYGQQFSDGIYGKPSIFPSRLFYSMHNIIPHFSQLNGLVQWGQTPW